MGNAESELTHAGNKKDCNKQTRWECFCARAWCREQHNTAVQQAYIARDSRAIEDSVQPSGDQLDQPVVAAVAPAAAVPPLFNSIEMWWHWYCCKIDRSSQNPAHGNHWATCKASWAALSQEDQAAFVELWEADRNAALSARRSRQAEAAASDADDEGTVMPSAHTPLASVVDNKVVGLDPRIYADFCCECNVSDSRNNKGTKSHAATFQRFVHGFARDRGHVPKRVAAHVTCDAVFGAGGAQRLRLFRAMQDATPRRL